MINLEKYGNSDTRYMFDRLKSDADRKWALMILSLAKEYFPTADHYMSGGAGKSYTNIVIGVRNEEAKKGKIYFYLYPQFGRINLWVKIKVLGKRFSRFINSQEHDVDACRAWFDNLAITMKKKGVVLEGNGLNPSDYKVSSEEESAELLVQSDDQAGTNLILYGPPGTGKTYATINESLKIIDGDFYTKNKDSREILKQKFDELVSEKRIQFVTFHQSFSYEDFVEGIRATIDEDRVEVFPESENASVNKSKGISYTIEKGIFGKICEEARRDKQYEKIIGVRDNAKIWKVSIEEASSSGETRQYCFKHGEVRIGWDRVGDIRKADLTDPRFKLGSKDQCSLDYFGIQIVPGDVVVCLGTRKSISGVGVVTGEYEYSPVVPKGVREDYVHKLPVSWLASNIDFNILELNKGKGLTLQTVYDLHRLDWLELQQALQAAGIQLAGHESLGSDANIPYVLIIDEINRGNISRIFGELITLIEPSKRLGADEALETILPYSKKPFSVPSNVFLIGTMNTADRSLAGLDIALRRRFTFKELAPDPECLDLSLAGGIHIGNMLKIINNRIEALLDRDHCIGHAYFMEMIEDQDLATIEQLGFIFEQKILPLLQEYFFEDWERIQWVLNDHRKAEKFQFIQKKNINMDALFGDKVKLGQRNATYLVNKNAFTLVESYLGILDHQKAHNSNSSAIIDPE